MSITTKANALQAKKALEDLFHGKAFFAFSTEGKVLEVRKPGWGYLLEYDEKADKVLSNLRLVMLGVDEDEDYTNIFSYFIDVMKEVAAM